MVLSDRVLDFVNFNTFSALGIMDVYFTEWPLDGKLWRFSSGPTLLSFSLLSNISSLTRERCVGPLCYKLKSISG